MSGSKHKSSGVVAGTDIKRKKELLILSRYHWIVFSRRYIELNPARNQNLWHQRQAWVTLQLAFCLLLLMILQLYHLSPSLPPPISNSSCMFNSSPCMPVLVLFKVLYCRILNVLFFVCLFSTYYLCEKYYKSITVQYYIVNCISWVPRLTLVDLQTTWTYEHTLGAELILM